MNYNVVTLEDCLNNYEKRNKTTVINDGNVVKFEPMEEHYVLYK